MIAQFTKWFYQRTVSPSIPGWYDAWITIYPGAWWNRTAYWNGEYWMTKKKGAIIIVHRWRGLTNPPKETKQKGEK